MAGAILERNRSDPPPRPARAPVARGPPARVRAADVCSLAASTMQFEYDPERLIEEVKKRPGIWDFDDADYRNKVARFKLWNEVVVELMQPNIKVSKSEMRELEIQLQKKWKGIRDCYQKFVTKRSKTKRPYIYSKQLQFLLKNHEDTPSKDDDDISSESDEAPTQRKVWRAKKKLKIEKDEEQSSDDDTSNCVETVDDSAKLNQSQTDEFVFANVDAPTKSDGEDPDKMFLLSLLPHLKVIPEECRLNVKMELMQVLRSANYNFARDYKLI